MLTYYNMVFGLKDHGKSWLVSSGSRELWWGSVFWLWIDKAVSLGSDLCNKNRISFHASMLHLHKYSVLWGHYRWTMSIDSAFKLRKSWHPQTLALRWVFFDLRFTGHGWKESFSSFPAPSSWLVSCFFPSFIVPARGCPVRKQQGEILPLNAPNVSF